MPRLLLVASLCLLCAVLAEAQATAAGRVRQYGPPARRRLAPYFAAQHVAYPPPRLVLVGLKAEQRLQLYAPDARGAMRLVRDYPILAASGGLGPKLREGDLQVPEGIYRLTELNPNSAYHLSLRVDYPNAFDRQIAARERRTNLGGAIYLHGNAVSAGCLAMGDDAAEELFVLAADTGLRHITLLLCPCDLRVQAPPRDGRAWVQELYAQLRRHLTDLPRPASAAMPAPPARRAMPTRHLPILAIIVAVAIIGVLLALLFRRVKKIGTFT